MKIVIIEPLGVAKSEIEKLSAVLKSGGNEITAYDTRTEDSAELIERGKDADIIMLANLPFRKEVISECKNLKMISVAFTGVDHVDMAYCKEKGILVSNCAGYSTNAVAELAFGLIIALYRRIIACDKAVRTSGTKDGLVGFELCGKKLGVIGTGEIGAKVIEIAQAFGCEVLAYSRTKKSSLEEKGVKYVSLDALMSGSDIVSLHVPLNEHTKGMIGEKQFSMMKPDAVFINTARGPIIDNAALANALKSGKIAGAGVDVFETEPPIDADHPLFGAPNTVVTPHVAFATKEALVKRAVIAFKNIEKWIDGEPQNVM